MASVTGINVLLEPSGAFLMQLSDQPAVRLTISRILFGCFFCLSVSCLIQLAIIS